LGSKTFLLAALHPIALLEGCHTTLWRRGSVSFRAVTGQGGMAVQQFICQQIALEVSSHLVEMQGGQQSMVLP